MTFRNFLEEPIIYGNLPWTGRSDGDDDGYRTAAISPMDAEDPDALEELPTYMCMPIYHIGTVPGLCEGYSGGLGGERTVLVRAPIARALERVQEILKQFGLYSVVLDGMRPWWVQTALWCYVRNQIVRAEALVEDDMSVYDQLRVGMAANDIGSYCATYTHGYHADNIENLAKEINREQLYAAAERLGMGLHDTAVLFLTFMANLRRNQLVIDTTAETSHGNGGTVDIWPFHWETVRPANMGVPYDYVPHPSVTISPNLMNYFDRSDVTPELYAETVHQDPMLRAYHLHRGVTRITANIFYEAQRNRRILYHTMRSVGFTFYFLECWHFTGPNWYGGRQVHLLPGSGNTCHAILANVCDRTTGLPTAVWSTQVAHQLARQNFGWRQPM